MSDDPAPFIVAEVSKNWRAGGEDSPLLISERFELVIMRNLRRGYRLHSFELHRLFIPPDGMNETIIAVFERSDSDDEEDDHE